jgi:hypothetical protein
VVAVTTYHLVLKYENAHYQFFFEPCSAKTALGACVAEPRDRYVPQFVQVDINDRFPALRHLARLLRYGGRCDDFPSAEVEDLSRR